MCALFGFLDYGKRVPWKTLQKLVQALANASEARGTHASGIAYNHDGHLSIFKRPKPAHKLHFRIPPETAAVMGHTRLTTQGDQKFNCNNHPFRGHAERDFALAHNGVLYNDSVLRVQHNLPETKIETDSYIAVQLIESQQSLDFDSMRYAAEQVQGYFTFTILDTQNNLYFVKGENPLYLIHFPILGMYVHASTKEIMTEALSHTSLQWQHCEVIDVSEGEILKQTPKGEIIRDKYTVQEPYAVRVNWYDDYYNWGCCGQLDSNHHDDNYAMLIDLCGFYGVSPEEVRYLLDMGYTYDEIEAFMMNPSELEAELSCSEL